MYRELSKYIKENDNGNANQVVMLELGKSLAGDRDNFLAIFDNAGIQVDPDSSVQDLEHKFIQNAGNKKLLLGAAYLVNHKYRTVGFDGVEEVNHTALKSTYKVMDDFFNAEGEDWSNLFGGLLGGGGGGSSSGQSGSSTPVAVPTGFGSAIATAVGQGAKLGNTIAMNHANKKNGAQVSINKATDSSNAILQGAMNNIQADKDKKAQKAADDARLLTYLMIAGGGVVFLGLVGIIIYKVKH